MLRTSLFPDQNSHDEKSMLENNENLRKYYTNQNEKEKRYWEMLNELASLSELYTFATDNVDLILSSSDDSFFKFMESLVQFKKAMPVADLEAKDVDDDNSWLKLITKTLLSSSATLAGEIAMANKNDPTLQRKNIQTLTNTINTAVGFVKNPTPDNQHALVDSTNTLQKRLGPNPYASLYTVIGITLFLVGVFVAPATPIGMLLTFALCTIGGLLVANYAQDAAWYRQSKHTFLGKALNSTVESLRDIAKHQSFFAAIKKPNTVEQLPLAPQPSSPRSVAK